MLRGGEEGPITGLYAGFVGRGGKFSAESLFATIIHVDGGGVEVFGAYNSGIIMGR